MDSQRLRPRIILLIVAACFAAIGNLVHLVTLAINARGGTTGFAVGIQTGLRLVELVALGHVLTVAGDAFTSSRRLRSLVARAIPVAIAVLLVRWGVDEWVMSGDLLGTARATVLVGLCVWVRRSGLRALAG